MRKMLMRLHPFVTLALTLWLTGRLLLAVAELSGRGYTPENAAACLRGAALPALLWAVSVLAGLTIPLKTRYAKLGKPTHWEASSRRKGCQAVLLIVAALLIALGVGNRGMRDVLVKAIQICTECIGLG